MSRYRYEPDTGLIFWAEGTQKAGQQTLKSVNTRGYLHGRFNGEFKMAHWVAWYLYHGHWPKGIDHINGNIKDNRIENLREAGPSTNNKNTALRKDNKSGQAGVYQSPTGSWKTKIIVDGVVEYLGTYQNLDDAIDARIEAQLKYNFSPRHGVSQ
tara:strand:+ start:44 stop:508 length:465 start_codon:yes stop_codon:yes gene_type:complete